MVLMALMALTGGSAAPTASPSRVSRASRPSPRRGPSRPETTRVSRVLDGPRWLDVPQPASGTDRRWPGGSDLDTDGRHIHDQGPAPALAVERHHHDHVSVPVVPPTSALSVPLTLVRGRLVGYQGPRCRECAGFRWASRGTYQGVAARAFSAALRQPGETRSRPMRREPWDPRAVSHPRLLAIEVPALVFKEAE